MGDKGRPICAALAVALGVLSIVVPGRAPRKKLIEWGWDEPDTAFLRANISEMEKTPFDGCVFSVRYGPGGRSGSFTWEFWGRRRFEAEDVADAFEDLRATRLRTFRESFLRVNVTPGGIDWFDDFAPVFANARLAGELVRAIHARGILLDVEQYQGQVFDYRKQELASAHSWEEYAACARQRGCAIMTAFQQSAPDLTLFLTFGYTLPWVLSEHGRKPLSDTPYGLLAPFLDGLLEGGSGGTRLVDGYELSYGFTDLRQFQHARRLFDSDVLPIIGNPQRYRKRMKLAFGLWLDYEWRRLGWDAYDTSRNYFSPEVLRRSLASALEASDDYVWVYGETPRWWGPPLGSGNRMPKAYILAIRQARTNHRSCPSATRLCLCRSMGATTSRQYRRSADPGSQAQRPSRPHQSNPTDGTGETIQAETATAALYRGLSAAR